MHTEALLPILLEFNGKKSFIKLMNGEILIGTIGEIQTEGVTSGKKKKPSVIFIDEENIKQDICLSEIYAIRLA